MHVSRIHLFIIAALCSPWLGAAQGVIRSISFDGSPAVFPDSAVVVHSYQEGGLLFTAIPGGDGFVRVGSNTVSSPGLPRNGTAFLDCPFTSSLSARPATGAARFGIIAVDLAEYSTVLSGPTTVEFIGYSPDGRTVSTSFTTDGIIGNPNMPDFQTFIFDSRFNDLVRFDVPGWGWSLDNLVVNYGVPEPEVGWLALSGAALFVLMKRGRHARRTRAEPVGS